MFFWGIVILLFVTGCDEPENWEELENESTASELVQFMDDYKEAWEESLEQQSYSVVEPFFIGNSHVYHMERRHHQQLTGERKKETLLNVSDLLIEANEYDEYRFTWNEEVEVDQVGITVTEKRTRTYYIAEGRDGYRITAIERAEEEE